MIFDALVMGHLRSNMWRAFISIVAIALGVATALALHLASALSVRTLDADRANFTQRVDLEVLPFGNRLPQAVLRRVRYADGVASAAPIIDRPMFVGVDRKGTGGDAARLIGVDVLQPLPGVGGFDEGRPGPFAPAGSFIDSATLQPNAAIVPAAMAARMQWRRGASFSILVGNRMAKLNVANVLPASATGVDASVVFVDVATAQTIVREPGTVDRIDVLTDASPATVRTTLAAAVGNAARLVVPEQNGFSLGALTGGIAATFGALASIGLAVGALLVLNAVGTSIVARRGDIATLRTLGAARSAIVAAFVCEGAAYGAVGGLLGAELANLAVAYVERAAGGEQSVLAYDLWTYVFAVVAGIGMAVVVALAPAMRAAAMAPALAANRGRFGGRGPGGWRSAAQSFAAAAAFALGIMFSVHPSAGPWFVLGFPLCFALGMGLAAAPFANVVGGAVRAATQGAPPALRLAGVTLAAIPKRVAIALAALSVAVFAAVAFDVASGSFAVALHAWAERAFAGDLVVRPFGGGTFDAASVARVRATPGVVGVVAVRTIHTQIGSTDVAVRGEDAAEPVPQVMMTEPPAQLGAPLAAALHVRTGDVVALRTAHRDLHVRVTSIHPDFSEARGAIVVARRVVREAFGDDRVDALRVTIDRRTKTTRVANAIVRRLTPLRTAIVTTRELRDRFTSAFDATFSFVGTLAGMIVAIASLGVGSALAALVYERRDELRILRTLGTRRSTIAAMLASEALVIALCGSAFGLIVGVALAALQLEAADPVLLGFAIPIAIPFAPIAALLVCTVVAALAGPLLAGAAASRDERT